MVAEWRLRINVASPRPHDLGTKLCTCIPKHSIKTIISMCLNALQEIIFEGGEVGGNLPPPSK